MRWLFDLLNSSIGKKITIGIAGLLLCCFLIPHLVGNLILFLGADQFNAYAHFLQTNPLTPLAELGLLALFLIHVIVTLYARWQNWGARPVAYEMSVSKGGRTIGSTTMIYTAFLLLAFLIAHVATFKYGWRSDFRNEELFERVMEFLGNPWIAGFYVLAMAGLGLHLSHGFQSAFQTLGINHPKYTPLIKAVGLVFAVATAAAFAAIPIWACWLGGAR
ncbi:MAG TPA: succinate dehydrogenase [Elusimicrobia bacterium]|nr:succinate dehydrogenase [Elusimicrobiota bacterium]HBT61686.1 succinate dehydrogenase [Elusimicrobiota bacterium]